MPRRPKQKQEHYAHFSATRPSHIQVPMQPQAPMQPHGTWQWMHAGACMSAPPVPVQYLERWPSYSMCPDMNAGRGAPEDNHGRASRRLNRAVHEAGKAERRKGGKKAKPHFGDKLRKNRCRLWWEKRLGLLCPSLRSKTPGSEYHRLGKAEA